MPNVLRPRNLVSRPGNVDGTVPHIGARRTDQILSISGRSLFINSRVIRNQRTNGPVNAHLISGPTVSTKTSFANFDIVLKWVKVNSGSSFI